MIDRAIIPYLVLFHASFNFTMMILFTWHGLLGLKVRRERKKGASIPFKAVKRHRKAGPILAPLGIAGFFIGLTLVYKDTGDIFKYPTHFSAGLVLVLSMATTFVISRKIKGPDSPGGSPTSFWASLFSACITSRCFWVWGYCSDGPGPVAARNSGLSPKFRRCKARSP